MEQTLASSFARLEHRIDLMQQLARSLTQAQAAVLALDVAALEAHTARQEQLCKQLRGLEDAPEADKLSIASFGDGAGSRHARWVALLQDLEKVRAAVRHQNRVHAALLDRARRSVAFLANVLASSSGSYCAPELSERACPTMEPRK